MLVPDMWSRKLAHWDGATTTIDTAFVLRFIGVKKIKRGDVVVVRVSHHHQPGRQERLELQLSGCELIANNTKPRAGELNGLSSLRRRLRKALSFMFWSLWMISKFLKRLACQSLISGVRLP